MADPSEAVHLNDECKVENTVYKRRSLLFQARSVICDEKKDDKATDKVTSNKDEKSNTKTDVESFDLKEYIKKLKQERVDWLQEYKNRRAERKSLIKKKENVMAQGQPFDINMLTEAEKEFVLACPNYEYMCMNNKKLLDTAMKISVLSQTVQKLNWRFMRKMEDNISKSTKNVIRISKE